MDAKVMSDSSAAYRLSEEQQSYAATCLNEQDDVREQKIAEVRRWLFSGGGTCDCVVYSTDEFFIIRFLRCCKFNVDAAKRKMKNYYEQRANIPEWYANKDPFLPEVQAFFNLGLFLPLRTTDSTGCTVIIIQPCKYDPSKQKIADLLKVCLMILDVAMKDNVAASLYGVRAIIDLEGVSMGHVLQLPPHVLKQLVHAWQDCYPLRIKSFHFVNPPAFLNVVLNVIKSFMVKKLRERIHVHSKFETLAQTIESDILPSRYCGTGESMDVLTEYWKKETENHASWLAAEEINEKSWLQKYQNDCTDCEKL